MKLTELKRTPQIKLPRLLYHGAPFFALFGIISNDNIGGTPNIKEPTGISTTSSKRVAADFAMARGDYAPVSGGIITMDSTKLNNDYKLIPFEYMDDDDEKEIKVLADKIAPLSSYMLWFVCPNKHIADALEFMQDENDAMWVADMYGEVAGDVDSIYQGIELIKTHPKRRLK